MFAQEKKRVAKMPSPSWTTVCQFLVPGVISVFVFLVDASSAQETVRAYNEFLFYGLGLTVSLLYSQEMKKRRRHAKGKQCKVEPLVETPSLLEKLRASARSAFSEVRTRTTQLIKNLAPPTAERRTAGQEEPAVPAWAVGACALFVASAGFGLLLAAFHGQAITQAEASFLDATPRECGPTGKPLKKGGFSSLGSISWLVIALGLASGLCSVHPLQSGMTIGF